MRRRRPPLRLGLTAPRSDLYYRLLTVPWSGFFAVIAAGYIAFNLLFAVLFRLQDGSIANSGDAFWNAFFFSVQTMATIGYGEMRPVSAYANVIVSIEVLLGLVGFALGTGVIFARFSRPTARVMFSAVAVVDRHDGRPTLMFRAANQRLNRIVEAQVSLTLARDEVTEEGVAMRRFYDLKPERARSPLFSLTWTVLHVIDEASPLSGAGPEALAAQGAQVLVTLIGLDETLSQTIHARRVYGAADILWGRRFVDILGRGKDGNQAIDFGRFHDTVPREESARR